MKCFQNVITTKVFAKIFSSLCLNTLGIAFRNVEKYVRGEIKLVSNLPNENSMIHNTMLITSGTFMKAIVTSFDPADPLFP